MSTLETLMRFSPPAIAMSLALLSISSVSYGKKRADHQINPASVTLVEQARAAQGAGKSDDAIDKLETALAIDPINREAYIVLGQVARSQKLPGKAIRFYREALLIEPNDIVALAGQGEAMVEKGAFAKAKDNLARIEKLCISVCAEQSKLAGLIEAAEKAPVVAAKDVLPKPVASAETSEPPKN